MSKIRLPYIQRFKDRQGRVRIYYRRNGVRVPLPGPVGSAHFLVAYANADKLAVEPKGVQKPRTADPRSIDALIVTYYRSGDFKSLSAATRANYRNILDRFRAKHGTKSALNFRTPHMEAILQSMSATPGAAKNLRKRLNTVFSLAVRLGWRDSNPIRESRPPRTRSGGFPPWSEEEIARFRSFWPTGSRERMALELLLCLGQRRSDTRIMGRQHVVDGCKIRVVQQKGGKRLTIRMHPHLMAEIDQHPNAMTFVTTHYGAPFSAAGFTQWFVEKSRLAGVYDRTPHGLRKAAGRRLAEAGCTAHQIMSILGHSTLSEAQRYTADARQEVLADEAISLLEGETRTPTVKPV